MAPVQQKKDTRCKNKTPVAKKCHPLQKKNDIPQKK